MCVDIRACYISARFSLDTKYQQGDRQMRSVVAGSEGKRGGTGARSEVDDQLVGLMARYKQPLYSYLLTLLADREVALDCTQDTFLRAYENLSAGRPVVARWLYKVAHNRAMDELRRRRKERIDMTALNEVPAEESMFPDPAEGVRQVLGRLSPAEREVLHLSLVDRLKSAEIAAILGISPTAVRMRLSRSREHFRQLYGDVE